jgi:2,4-dienoyl-CoA reductase (NADPH2)
LKPLKDAGNGSNPRVFLIGGALEAKELDAKRAIDQGTRLAACIETASSGEHFDAPKDKHFIMDALDIAKKMFTRN